MIKDLLATYTTYNVWANKRIIELVQKNMETFDLPTSNSFPTIRRTLLHILDAEYGWLSRLQGTSVLEYPGDTFEGTAEDVFQVVIDKSMEFDFFVKDKTINDFAFIESDLDFKDAQGTPYKMPVTGIIQHCMNHSTYHRGQIVMMLRTHGAENMVSTDLITYLRLLKQ